MTTSPDDVLKSGDFYQRLIYFSYKEICEMNEGLVYTNDKCIGCNKCVRIIVQ